MQASYSRIYEDDEAAVTRVRQTLKEVEELAEYDTSLTILKDSKPRVVGRALFSLRDFADSWSSLRHVSRRSRIGWRSCRDSSASTADRSWLHLNIWRLEDRLRQIETSDERERES